MKRLPWLLFMAAALLPGLALATHSQHVFWLPESVLWLTLTPFAALLAWWATRAQVLPPLPQNLKRGFALLWLLCFLSAALAFRRDLSFLALAQWSGYALLFFAAWRLAADEGRRRQAVALLLAYGILSTAYAALQVSGGDGIAWTTQFGGRTGAFLGNPNFLGGHLALLFPVALALALDTRQKDRGPLRMLGPWVLVLVLAAGLLMTQTRGAWLGAGIGSVLVLGLAQRHMGTLLQRNQTALLRLGLVGLVVLAAYFVQRPQTLGRLADTFNGQDTELARRGFLMKKAAQLAMMRPLLGVGPGNFRIHFARVQALGADPTAPQAYVVGEHAHNDFLQMAAEAGWPAALLWAALMAWVLKALYGSFAQTRVARAGAQGGLLGLGVLGGLTALLIHGMANFPFLILPTQGAAWVLVALVLRAQAVVAVGEGQGELVDEVHAASVPSSPYAGWILALGLALCCVNAGYQGQRLALDRLWWIGQGELDLGHFDVASTWLQRALKLDSREDRLWALHGRAEEGGGRREKSLGSLRQAQSLAPFDAELALRLGRGLIDTQHFDQAERVLSGAYAYAPHYQELWDPLAASLFYQGKFAEAVALYDRMIALGYGAENPYVNKAAAQGSQGHLEEALQTLKQAEEHFPQGPKIYLSEAITYLKLKQKPAGRAALQQAMRLSPQDPQIEALQKALR